jgi:hypothetical protein
MDFMNSVDNTTYHSKSRDRKLFKIQPVFDNKKISCSPGWEERTEVKLNYKATVWPI